MQHHYTPGFSKTCLALGVTLALAAQIASAHSAAAADLDVNISDINAHKGTIMVGLYTSQDDYDKNVAHYGRGVAVDGKTMQVAFTDLPAGTYAVKIFQDVNDNGQLDMRYGGIPTEPFGFSNNAPANYGPASWSDARFDLSDGKAATQSVRLTRLHF
ncbi:MAG: hypothetical protein COA84_06985 [Robiginitomaculum sp.]|nr:MAG: hypothetical protein COA84_06985 [Robiginitomaculum sp.]